MFDEVKAMIPTAVAPPMDDAKAKMLADSAATAQAQIKALEAQLFSEKIVRGRDAVAAFAKAQGVTLADSTDAAVVKAAEAVCDKIGTRRKGLDAVEFLADSARVPSLSGPALKTDPPVNTQINEGAY
jgi:hypothetical protein